MKRGEIVVHMDNYNSTNFHQNQMKNKKVLLIAHFSVQNFKVSVELWKLYIVLTLKIEAKMIRLASSWSHLAGKSPQADQDSTSNHGSYKNNGVCPAYS